jgi:hypothetical protein
MMKISLLVGGCALGLLASCAPLDPELPTGDEEQIDRPATLGGLRPHDPLAEPDEATLPYVPGQ